MARCLIDLFMGLSTGGRRAARMSERSQAMWAPLSRPQSRWKPNYKELLISSQCSTLGQMRGCCEIWRGQTGSSCLLPPCEGEARAARSLALAFTLLQDEAGQGPRAWDGGLRGPSPGHRAAQLLAPGTQTSHLDRPWVHSMSRGASGHKAPRRDSQGTGSMERNLVSPCTVWLCCSGIRTHL